MIKLIQTEFRNVVCVIYSEDEYDKFKLVEKVQNEMNILVDSSKLFLVKLKTSFFANPKLYKVFSLLAQSLMSSLMGFEIAFRLHTDVVIGNYE